MKTSLLLCGIVTLLSACTITPPRVTVRPPIEIKPVVIDVDGDHGHGGFCPPGQAKKGNCRPYY